ncbi:protein-tyrosine phosphatase [Cercophora newfieldiana]|uniref:protein-tyrosine-phosphatase n=1 Tax=Cercophora newfieldiana TaxID=92897 RepID=A0AA39YEA2_9PEZI|nr:protein-tyrosine phosphatase [Cercophora newfieldiana]
MKTAAGLPPPGASHTPAGSHSRSNSQSFFFNNKQGDTPLASPRAPHSVGQPLAPKLSPSAHRGLAQDGRTPSPNYFGLAIEPSADPRDSSLLPRENWSSPTSSVKSFGAAIPNQLPLDANPEFEAFRRQVDVNRGKMGFNLSASQFSLPAVTPLTPLASTPSALQRPRPPRWHTHASDSGEAASTRPSGSLAGILRTRDARGSKSNAETASLQDSAYGSADSKRNSEASLTLPLSFGLRTHESPAQLELPFPAPDRGRPSFSLNILDQRHSGASAIAGRTDASRSPATGSPSPKLEPGDPTMISPDQLRDLLADDSGASVLILDLRVSPQYAMSRVKGALNLCIPTTLLKRATFNLQKLQHTFQAENDQEKFASWRDSTHLVVYDAQSSDRRDAASAMNMIKKFANEGYSGSANILRGGFNAFAAAHPELVDRTSGRSSPGLSLGGAPGAPSHSIAPVIGGVMLPAMTSNPNPFFSNIRQNQDLVDGVGQMDIKLPSGLDGSRLPRWLGEAAEVSDHGKKVSDKFLGIELREQSRMKDAYCVQTHPATGTAAKPETKVQLSGIEQGGKNRYKDILPFEHARVRLLGRPEGSCDYVNASHIRANRSHKRYIASQGPLPATFEDFWSVIWDQDVRVIVMLTAESEGGQLKCHPYWKGNDFGSIRLRVLSEKKVSLDIDKHRSDSTSATLSTQPNASKQDSTSRSPSQAEVGRRRANTTTTLNSTAPSPAQASGSETPHVIIRKFALSHAAHPFSPIREVTQLHYPSWPDFGAPAQPSHLLALVELSNIMQQASLPADFPGLFAATAATARSGSFPRGATKSQAVPLSWHDAPESGEHVRPMLVHCSAGCGRTGAFCTVDSVIDMLKRQRLRAVQRANKRIDERERRLTQQTEGNARVKRQAFGRDPDGDVSMGDEMPPFAPMDEAAERRSTDSGSRSASDSEHSFDEKEIDTSWLDDDNVDLIANTVEDFRGQRLSMVQSLRQFVLCYETILEWVARLQDRGDNSSSGPKGRARSGSLAM